MIEIKQLTFAYDRSSFALQIEQLDLDDGEHVALVGPSGCGKTTLLNLLAGVLPPVTGSVRVAGEVITHLAEDRVRDFRIRHLGLIFQNFELLDYLDVRDNILLPLRIGRGFSVTKEFESRAEALSLRLGIADKFRRHPPQLSQGERQRVAVCRALLLDPAVILADEPTGNLDPANKFTVLDLLLENARESGSTVLAVTHDLELLDRFDRVLDFSDLNDWKSA